MLREFKNLADMEAAFPTEQACIDHFAAVRWPDPKRIGCPHCGLIDAHWVLKGNLHKCNGCYKKFSVRIGTIFEDSKISLRKWFMAIFLMTSHKKGISSCQLAKDIGVTQKTAWFMLHRIRNATMTREFNAPLSGTIEMDEAYVGPRAMMQHANKRNKKERVVVFGMLQRGGELRLHHVPNSRKKVLQPIVLANVALGSTVYTDDANTYYWMREKFGHALVKHSLHEYVRGDVTTNRIEGVFSHFKRTIFGTYHKASDKHLDRYLQAFAFRWNSRKMGEDERVNDLLRSTQGRRLSYKALIN